MTAMAKKKKTTQTKSNRRKSKKKLIRKRKALKPINFKRELAAGIKVELEHTKHIRSKAKARKVAERIARDHLSETPSYYRRLKKCFPHEHHNNPGRPGKSCMTAQLRVPGRNPVSADDMEAMNRLAAKMHEAAKRAGRTNTDTADLTPSERAQYRRLRGKFGAALVLGSPRFHEGMGGSPSYNPKSMKNYIVKEMMPDWKRKIDPRSIRTKTIYTKKGGKRLLRIGCPKGEWMPRIQRCKVGTKAISMLTPKSEKILSLHGKAAAHRAASNPGPGRISGEVLVKSTSKDHSPGAPYEPRLVEHRLYRIPYRLHGKRYYTDCGTHPASRTWISDGEAKELIRAWSKRPSGRNPTKKFWRDMSVKTSDMLGKCHAAYTGKLTRALTADEYKEFRDTSKRIGSNLKQLADSEEQIEKDPRFKHLLRLGHTFNNPSGRLTIKQAKQQMPSGFVLSKDQAGEYVVRQRGSPAGEGYFTNDLQDAVDTARDMARRESQRSRSRIVPRRMNPHDERSRMAIPGHRYG